MSDSRWVIIPSWLPESLRSFLCSSVYSCYLFLISSASVKSTPSVFCAHLSIKKAEHWRTDAFELWCWERFLRIPWTARRSNQSILKEFSPVHFIGRTDAEAEVSILWPPDVNSPLIRKDPEAGKDWRQEEKGTTEDKMVGWHHWLNGQEFEQTPEDGEGQGSLACSSPWVRNELDMTEQLNNNQAYPSLFSREIFFFFFKGSDLNSTIILILEFYKIEILYFNIFHVGTN